MAKNNNSFGKKIAGAGLAFMMGGTSLIAAPAQAFALPSTQTTTALPGTMVSKDDVHTLTTKGAFAGAGYKVITVATGSYSVDANGVSSFGNVVMNDAAKATVVSALASVGVDVELDGKSAEQQANAIMEGMEKVAKLKDPVKSQTLANRLATIDGKIATANSSGDVTFSGLNTGYYIVVSADNAADYASSGAMTSAIMTTVYGDTTVAIKTTYPTGTQSVEDLVNPSAWENVGIADIGLANGDLDKLMLTSTFKMPANWADYNDAFVLEMRQTLPQGMIVANDEVQAGGSWKVKLTAHHGNNQKNILGNAVMSVENGNVVLARVADMREALAGLGTDVTIELQMTPVMDNADVEAMYGEMSTLEGHKTVSSYSNYTVTPYEQDKIGSRWAETAPKTSNVFSYNLDLTNLDEAGSNLAGSDWKITKADGGEVAGSTIVRDQNGNFQITSLESDTPYVLEQTKVPMGKRSVDPITFTISANEADGKITAITSEVLKDTSNAVTEITEDNATVLLKVTNLDGFDLPLTGGAGIIASVVIGSAGLYFAGRSFSKKENN